MKREDKNRFRWLREKGNSYRLNPFVLLLCIKSFQEILSFALPLLFLITSLSVADEKDFKIDPSNTFSIVEKKAVFNKYEGKLSKKGPDWMREQFPGQKIFIRPISEWGSEIIFNGSPLKEKYGAVDQLVFSPDHKVALASGIRAPLKTRINLINKYGHIYKIIDFRDALETVKCFEDGFVVMSAKGGAVNFPGQYVRLSKYDYSGNEIWQKTFNDGIFWLHMRNKISVSVNGDIIIFSFEKGNWKQGTTYFLDGMGNIIDHLDEAYQSVISGNNDVVLLVNRKHLRLIDLKDKIIFYKKDLDEESRDLFDIAEGDQNDMILATQRSGNRLDEIIGFDAENKKIIHFDAGSKDWGVSKFYYSSSENKFVIKLLGKEDSFESIDLKK